VGLRVVGAGVGAAAMALVGAVALVGDRVVVGGGGAGAGGATVSDEGTIALSSVGAGGSPIVKQSTTGPPLPAIAVPLGGSVGAAASHRVGRSAALQCVRVSICPRDEPSDSSARRSWACSSRVCSWE
jgi:hypothetical protein